MSVRVLCLHGYLQDASVFSSRLGHLRKTNPLKRECEFTFLNAPFVVVEDVLDDNRELEDGEGVEDDEDGEHGENVLDGRYHRQVLADEVAESSDGASVVIGRSWWQFSSSASSTSATVRPSQSFEYAGVDVSVGAIRQAIKEHRIDTIMGFSQGAAMAAYFAATQDVADLGVRRLLTYAGFLPKDPHFAEHMLHRGPIPSSLLRTMHVAGTADELITIDRTRRLGEVFEGARFVEHPGGHFVPTTKLEMKDRLVEFLLG